MEKRCWTALCAGSLGAALVAGACGGSGSAANGKSTDSGHADGQGAAAGKGGSTPGSGGSNAGSGGSNAGTGGAGGAAGSSPDASLDSGLDAPTIESGPTSCDQPASPILFAPANGSTTTTLYPSAVAQFDRAIDTLSGTVEIQGSVSPHASFDLSSNPAGVRWTDFDKTLTVMPGIKFAPGEQVTVSLHGFKDAECGNSLPPSSWSFQIVTPPCTTGNAGLVGTSTAFVASGVSTAFYPYLAVDDNPGGYVYVGDETSLWRMPKAGGISEKISTIAGLGDTHLGRTMLVAGDSIFTVDGKVATSSILWRISSDGGVSWKVEDFASFSGLPTGGFGGLTHYKDRIYLVTNTVYPTFKTQIWSVTLRPTLLPAVATVDASTSVLDCDGIAVDDHNFYLACDRPTRIVRIDRSTGATTTLFTQGASGPLIASDMNGDGTADFLYFDADGNIFYICSPASAAPFADMLLSSYDALGLALDRSANQLWAWRKYNRNFLTIH